MSQHEIKEGREPTEAKKIKAPRPEHEQMPLVAHPGARANRRVSEPVPPEVVEENRRRSREERMRHPFYQSTAPGGHKVVGPGE